MHLFVAGCPRSGTTILTRLLNLHPDIVIGLERYKQLYGRSKRIAPDALLEENFFNFKPEETNYAPASNPDAARFYEDAKAKFPKAKFIGDKYPQFFRFYAKVFQAFPDARFVFIVRNPLSVAQSWQRRSEDSSSWPQKNDARRSIAYWNDALAYTLAYSQAKDGAFVFIEYEELFRSQQEALANLFYRIGADISPGVLAKIADQAAPHFARSGEIVARKIELPQETVEAVRDNADWSLYEHVRQLARSQKPLAPVERNRKIT